MTTRKGDSFSDLGLPSIERVVCSAGDAEGNIAMRGGDWGRHVVEKLLSRRAADVEIIVEGFGILSVVDDDDVDAG